MGFRKRGEGYGEGVREMASRFLDPGPAAPAKEPEKPDPDLTGGLRGFGQGCGPADGRSRFHAGEA